MDKRTSKENYYLDIADAVLQRSTCLRRMYGAIIVRNDEIISTGYNGAPRGRINCTDAGRCARVEMRFRSWPRSQALSSARSCSRCCSPEHYFDDCRHSSGMLVRPVIPSGIAGLTHRWYAWRSAASAC